VRLETALRAANERSPLPLDPPNAAEVEAWLIAQRRDALG
jgi:hypothetical protein